MKQVFNNDWQHILAEEFDKQYYQDLSKFIAQEYNSATVFPQMDEIMNAFHSVAYKDVKVVILGQDPYHGPGQAHGMCFSVRKGIPHPPSLRNIFKELQEDLGYPIPKDGYLMTWAEQGVFLLNTVLTVRHGVANSHKGRGWEQFTDAVIKKLAKRADPMIFVLWGKPAQTKQVIINQEGPHHLILQAPHPSPLSAHRGFFGSRPFSKINSQLEQWGREPVDWSLIE